MRDVIVGGSADHSWAAEPGTRAVVEHLLAGVDLDTAVNTLSGGERRRTALAAIRLGDHELLVLDEPTNHLDVEAVAWLAEQLRLLLSRGVAMIVVSHDRWFLDAVCTRMWEVHDGTVDAYDGGYSAYVLARAERARQAAGIAAGAGTCCARSWPGCVEGRPPAPRSPSSASTRPIRSSPTSPRPGTRSTCAVSPRHDSARTSSI